MAISGSKREVEIKLKVASAAAARRLLRQAGFAVHRPRVFEDNLVFDTADHVLRNAGKLLRVRRAGRETLVTYKGPAAPGPHKSREELEAVVAGDVTSILERLGFIQMFRYQKYRTEYARPRERGIVTLDQTPIGCYLEIEGAPRWIDQTARRLGFAPADYITSSYGGLYLHERKLRPMPPDMVFRSRAI